MKLSTANRLWAACVLLVGFAPLAWVSGAAIKQARSPKDLATSGSNQPMRQTNAAPVLVPAAKSLVSIIKPPPRAPWVISKSFQFSPVVGAAGYNSYVSTNDGVTWKGPMDLGTNTIITFTNIPPRRPLRVRTSAYDSNRLEGAFSEVSFLGVSPSSWQSGATQYFALSVPAGVATVTAIDLVTHRKTIVGSYTNQTVITLQRPAMALETFLVEVR